MPSGKSKEDTWKASDLEKSIKGSKDERKHHRDKERDRHRDKDRDKERDKHRDKDRDKERDKHHDRDRDRHHDKDRDKERDRHHDKDRDKEREKRHDKDRERHHDKDRKDKDRHRDGDGKDHERHHRDGEHRDKNRHKDEADGSRRRHRDDREHRSKHHDDKDIDRPHRKRRDEDRGHKDDRHRHKDQVDEKSRKHRSRDEDDKERSRKHQEYKERESREKKERQEEEKKKQDKEEEDFNYEDDFEDYDDDFEDDDYKDDDTNSYESSEYSNKMKKGELDEICEAVNKESDRLLAEYKRTNIPKESEQKPKKTFSSSAPTFINFVSAKQRHINKKAMGKLARRGYELQEMIEFDVADYDIFDMPPVAEYNIYMRNFGSSTAKQAYVQTNEDNIDREIQTEEIEFKVKWTQQPPHEIISSGDPENTRDLSKDIGEPIDMPRLSAFVERASQVMMTLMEEDYMDIMETEHSRSQHSNIIISDAFTNLNIPNFLKDRPVITSHFSAVHTHMLLMLHRTPVKPSSDPLTRQGCICVWNVNNPDQPQQILMCESQPKCCCFSPTKTNLIFSGMQDGCLVCWDTREPSSLHKYHKHNDTNWLLRYPTYNTAGVLHYDNHQSPVVAISTIVAPRESASASLNHKDMDDELSFQLASLEENGTIHLWVVAQLSRSDVAGSESDFGLAPGGRIKLIKSFTIKLESPLRNTELRTTMKCADIQLLPTNNSHYYVASDTGCVIHGLRYGGKALPRAYRPQTENIVQVTTIDFSPFPEPVFLAGCEDGSLRMYHIDNEWPLLTWLMSTDGRAIRLVRWCRSRPAVFFVVDVSSRLYIWDLLMDDSGPLKHEKISEQHLTSLSLSNDYSATGLGLPGRRPQMVICLESGCCEVHTMSQKFSALMSDELDQFSAFLQKIS